jgi:hypothetical protein
MAPSSCGVHPVDALYFEPALDPKRRKTGSGFRDAREPATRPKLNSIAIQYRDGAESSVFSVSVSSWAKSPLEAILTGEVFSAVAQIIQSAEANDWGNTGYDT